MDAGDFRSMLIDEIRELNVAVGALTGEVAKLQRPREPVEVLAPEERYKIDSKFRSMVDTMLVALEEKSK